MLTLLMLKQSKEYPKIKVLNCCALKLSNIDNLQLFPFISILNLSFNKIESIEVLKYLTNLREVYLQHNFISNITVLYYRSFKVLDVSYNYILNCKEKVKTINCTTSIYKPQQKGNTDILDSIKEQCQLLTREEKLELIKELT